MATLPPEKSIAILEELIKSSAELRGKGPHSEARKVWMHSGDGALQAALSSSSTALVAFRLAEFATYSVNDVKGNYWKADQDLIEMVAALQSAVEQLRWQLPDSQQHTFFPAGTQHDAFVEIRKIIAAATKELLIVDSYVDESLWPLLKNIPSGVAIRILTANPKADFVTEGKAFAKQHGTSVAARKTKDFHDRFIFVDAGVCWHLGASIKDAGGKAFMFSEVKDPTTIALLLQSAETTWNAATVLL